MDFKNLTTYAKENGASDIHLAPKHQPIVRVDGELRQVRVGELGGDDILKILDSIMNDGQKEIFRKDLEVDFSVKIGSQRYRVNAYHTSNGPTVALRIISENIRTLGELNVPAIVEKFTHLSNGLILVTGPTGSGKSTTLAAMIDHINKNTHKHILTIEDPIEYVFQSDKSLINQREVNTHTLSFAKSLKSALREDPDIIMLGELRDIEAIHLALTAAETGHLVLGTLHTSSAAKTIDRIIDVFPANDKPMIRSMLSGSIQGIIAQTLVKRKENKGRVAAYEIMVANNAIRNLIRENKLSQINSLMQIGSKQGMITMNQSLQAFANQGILDPEVFKALLPEEQHEENTSKNNKTMYNKSTLPDDEF